MKSEILEENLYLLLSQNTGLWAQCRVNLGRLWYEWSGHFLSSEFIL